MRCTVTSINHLLYAPITLLYALCCMLDCESVCCILCCDNCILYAVGADVAMPTYMLVLCCVLTTTYDKSSQSSDSTPPGTYDRPVCQSVSPVESESSLTVSDSQSTADDDDADVTMTVVAENIIDL